ncbi:MAG: helix-turn-helix domain-containing protein [Ilumatobacteraceae bacterium]
MIVVRGVVIPERVVAAYGRAIASAVRTEIRRNGGRADVDLFDVLGELEACAKQWATPTTAVATAAACVPDCRSESIERCTVHEAAELIGCRERNVRDLIARAVLPAERATKGRGWLIDRRAVVAYAEQRRAA